jgi:hypothetical protein
MYKFPSQFFNVAQHTSVQTDAVVKKAHALGKAAADKIGAGFTTIDTAIAFDIQEVEASKKMI